MSKLPPKRIIQLTKASEQSKRARKRRLIVDAVMITKFIKNNRSRCLSQLAKDMGWSYGKTQNVLNYAENIVGSILSIYTVVNGRNKRRFSVVQRFDRLKRTNIQDEDSLMDFLNKIEKLHTEARELGLEIAFKDDELSKPFINR